MKAGAPVTPMADWVVGDVLVVVFAVLVTLILDVVPGWSAPLHAWMAIAAATFAALSVHALANALASARHRRWRRAGMALVLGGALASSALAMRMLGVRLGDDGGGVQAFDDRPVSVTKGGR